MADRLCALRASDERCDELPLARLELPAEWFQVYRPTPKSIPCLRAILKGPPDGTGGKWQGRLDLYVLGVASLQQWPTFVRVRIMEASSEENEYQYIVFEPIELEGAPPEALSIVYLSSELLAGKPVIWSKELRRSSRRGNQTIGVIAILGGARLAEP